MVTQFKTNLMERLKTTPDGLEAYEWLNQALKSHLENHPNTELDPELRRRVTLNLENAIKNRAYLGEFAVTAANFPQWHGQLRDLLARKPILFDSQVDPQQPQRITTLFKVIDSGHMVPDLALQFIPTSPLNGRISWHFAGLLAPGPIEAERYQRQERTRLPWRALALPLTEKFDAFIFASDELAPFSERLVARIEKLPATGEIAITGLPRSGKLRLLLIQREEPRYTGEIKTRFNTMPVLLDTHAVTKPTTPSPAGWELLCEPRSLDTTSWEICQTANPGTPWPTTLHLILMDDKRNVCAATNIGNSASRNSGNSLISTIIHQHQLAAPPDPSHPTSSVFAKTRYVKKKQPPSISISGAPTQFALARCTHSINMPRNIEATPRLTVQEAPPPPRSTTVAGTFQALRFWHIGQIPNHRYESPLLFNNPARAVWYENDEIFVMNPDHSGPPVTIKLPAPPSSALETVSKAGSCLLLKFMVKNPPHAPESNSSIVYSIDLDAASPVAIPHECKESVTLHSLESLGIPDTTAIARETGSLYGLFLKDGRVIKAEPQPDASKNPSRFSPQLAINATSFACYDHEVNRYQIWDWTAGTLKSLHTTEAPSSSLKPPQQELMQISGEGLISDASTQPVESWQSPLQLSKVQMIDNERALGYTTSPEGVGSTLILLRKTRPK